MESTNKELAYKEFVAAKKKKVNALTKVIKEHETHREGEINGLKEALDILESETQGSEARSQDFASCCVAVTCRKMSVVHVTCEDVN